MKFVVIGLIIGIPIGALYYAMYGLLIIGIGATLQGIWYYHYDDSSEVKTTREAK